MGVSEKILWITVWIMMADSNKRSIQEGIIAMTVVVVDWWVLEILKLMYLIVC